MGLFYPNGFSGMLRLSGLPHALLHIIVRPMGPSSKQSAVQAARLVELKKRKEKGAVSSQETEGVVLSAVLVAAACCQQLSKKFDHSTCGDICCFRRFLAGREEHVSWRDAPDTVPVSLSGHQRIWPLRTIIGCECCLFHVSPRVVRPGLERRNASWAAEVAVSSCFLPFPQQSCEAAMLPDAAAAAAAAALLLLLAAA